MQQTSPLETTSWVGSVGSFVLAIPATLLSIWAFQLSRRQAQEQQRQADESARAMQAVVGELRTIAEKMDRSDLQRQQPREEPEHALPPSYAGGDSEDDAEHDEGYGMSPQPAPATQHVQPGHFPPRAGAPGHDEAPSSALTSLANRLAGLESRAETTTARSAQRQRRTVALAAISAAVALGAFGAGLLNVLVPSW